MEIEKRRAERTDINVKVQLRDIQGKPNAEISEEKIEVRLLNISKNGIAFACSEKLVFNGFYDTEIVFPNKERFAAIVEVVRIDEENEADQSYGCTFVGINSADQFKISVYQVLYEFDRI